MATNKERIEQLEAGLGGLQDGMSRMELGLTDKLHHMEETIHKLSEAFLSNREGSNTSTNDRQGRFKNTSDPYREQTDGSRQVFSSKLAKLEFLRYSGDDPTEWFNRVEQFFEYQGTTAVERVSLASFHLEGEANQWWDSSANANVDTDEEVEDAVTNNQDQPEISFYALTGWTASKTMRITAKIGHHEVVVLIDNGSTHNFISEKIADKLHLPVIPTEPFTVKVANGRPLMCKGRFEHVPVIL
ncbi:hypothetical protein F0562_026465 [Nyssa sinensis]|uniref:Retrotransposon gag domain-containing protein n=1 Tax=Nyssa sinensis TaxID=561372 RepID=A0A5J5B9A3_9ASTE|nr:hypothetical protein F0562_026465 [Nyssa sinensis]